MDIFKFINPTAPTKMEQGEIINGLKSKLWVERYDVAGEFSLVSPASAGVREKLPTGTFISHTDTSEIMIVENHELSDEKGEEPELITTGRGFETIMEQRVTGWQSSYPQDVADSNDVTFLPTGTIWYHIQLLMNLNIIQGVAIPDNAIPYLKTMTNLSGPAVTTTRNIERGELYKKVLELLKVDKLGLRVYRPGPTNPDGPTSDKVVIFVHRGVDRSNEIVFSYDTGEIESADYLWSNKKLKNTALITGKWIQTVYEGPEVGIDRRVLEIDGTSVDGHYTTEPTAGQKTTIVNDMEQLAIDTLSAYNEVQLTKAEVSKDNRKSIYRQDFDVGDLITVSGDYNANSTMRISEYVEIEDEHGSQGYPTLSDVT